MHKRNFCLFVILLISFLSLNCNKHQDKSPIVIADKSEPSVDKISFYIDNSISMDGYINGNTEFKDAVSGLLLKSEYLLDTRNVQLNLVNSDIHLIRNWKPREFIQNLSPGSSVWNVGGIQRKTSDLNNIINQILAKVDSHSVCIFISDCIYSLVRQRSVVGNLSMQKNMTMNAFFNAFRCKMPLNTIVQKLISSFNGDYYDMNSNRIPVNCSDRPYYIWFIGLPNILENYFNKINIENIIGSQNTIVFSSLPEPAELEFTLLQKTNIIGVIKPDQSMSEKDLIHGLKDIQLYNGLARFSCAVNLSGFPFDDQYFATSQNIKTLNNHDVKIERLVAESNIHPNDQHYINSKDRKYTHLVTISTSNILRGVPITFEVVKNIPSWVDTINTINDIPIKDHLSQTFGLRSLIEGIYEAYKTAPGGEKSYCKVTIPLSGN